jgi:hypothetical protein
MPQDDEQKPIDPLTGKEGCSWCLTMTGKRDPNRYCGECLGRSDQEIEILERLTEPRGDRDPDPGRDFDPASRLLGSREAAALLGCGLSTLSGWCREGRGPAWVWRSGRRMFHDSDLRAYAETASRKPETSPC